MKKLLKLLAIVVMALVLTASTAIAQTKTQLATPSLMYCTQDRLKLLNAQMETAYAAFLERALTDTTYVVAYDESITRVEACLDYLDGAKKAEKVKEGPFACELRIRKEVNGDVSEYWRKLEAECMNDNKNIKP